MPASAAFLAPTPLAPNRLLHASALCSTHRKLHARRHRYALPPVCATPSPPPPPPPPPPSSSSSSKVLKEGAIVAVRRGSSGAVDIARVTGASSSGTTVDIELLEPFVSELYVPGGSRTYARATEVRVVRAEYAASQSGWIVLNAAVRDAETQFRAADAELAEGATGEERTVVVEREARELSEEALSRQFFRPSKMQAFSGAALSVPLGGALFKAYQAAVATYAANPAGQDLMGGELFRTIVRVALAAGSAGSLVVGAGLLFYALSMSDDDGDDGNS